MTQLKDMQGKEIKVGDRVAMVSYCLLYTSPSPRD